MLVACWASIVDGEPAFKQHCDNILCMTRWSLLASTAANVISMLGKRRIRWSNIEITLCQRLTFDWNSACSRADTKYMSEYCFTSRFPLCGNIVAGEKQKAQYYIFPTLIKSFQGLFVLYSILGARGGDHGAVVKAACLES